MSELLIELFSEEMPPNLQINARNQMRKLFSEELSLLNLKHKDFEIYSTPTRLTIFISGLPSKIKVLPSEIKGPKELKMYQRGWIQNHIFCSQI